LKQCRVMSDSHARPEVLTQAWALKLPNAPTWLGCPSLAHRIVLVATCGNGATGQECFAMLSPVQMAPCRWEPAKKERVKTKGRTLGRCQAGNGWEWDKETFGTALPICQYAKKWGNAVVENRERKIINSPYNSPNSTNQAGRKERERETERMRIDPSLMKQNNCTLPCRIMNHVQVDTNMPE